MADRIEPEQLLFELANFTGTAQWYRNPLYPKFLYTDGVRYLAEKAQCYWLIDYIFSNQSAIELSGQEFQRWEITVTNKRAIIKVGDGNATILKEFKIGNTTFPLDTYTLWFVDNVLLLVSEY